MTNKFDDLSSLTALEKQLIRRYTDDCYTEGEPESKEQSPFAGAVLDLRIDSLNSK
jgi:hypothetical protein